MRPRLHPGPLRRFHQILEFGGKYLTGLRVVAQRLDIGADVPGMENVQRLVNAPRTQQPEQRVHQTVTLLRIHGGDHALMVWFTNWESAVMDCIGTKFGPMTSQE